MSIPITSTPTPTPTLASGRTGAPDSKFQIAQSDRISPFGGFVVPDKWGRVQLSGSQFKLEITRAWTKKWFSSASFHPTVVNSPTGRQLAFNISVFNALTPEDARQAISTIARVGQDYGISVLTADPPRNSDAAKFLKRLGFVERVGSHSDGTTYSLQRPREHEANMGIGDILVPKLP